MSDSRTGFYWVDILEEARRGKRRVTVGLKSNPEMEATGFVQTVGTGVVTLVDPDDPDMYAGYVLLDEIAAVEVDKTKADV
jgi:hypothetical protein